MYRVSIYLPQIDLQFNHFLIRDEVLPAATVRQLPAGEVELLLTAHEGGGERPIGSYTLVHGGLLHR